MSSALRRNTRASCWSARGFGSHRENLRKLTCRRGRECFLHLRMGESHFLRGSSICGCVLLSSLPVRNERGKSRREGFPVKRSGTFNIQLPTSKERAKGPRGRSTLNVER